MRYALVENGQIVDGPRALPNGWRNISGLCFMDQKDLKSLGWRLWRFVEVPAPANYAPLPSLVQITADEIIETQQWRPKTAAELAAEEAARIAEIDRQRAEAYRAESDPLFFKAQRGEATQQEWLDAVAAIKARLPKTQPAPASTGTGA